MIRHFVLFRLAAEDAAQRRADAEGMVTRLTGLLGVVPELRAIEVQPDLGATAGNWDLALVSEYEDAAALDRYQVHPAHQEVAAWIKGVIAERACVDIELPGA